VGEKEGKTGIFNPRKMIDDHKSEGGVAIM